MPKFIDLTGERFGRLVVIKRVENDKHGNSCWLCKCDCEQEVVVRGFSIKKKNTQSCGCFRKETAVQQNTKHGHSKRYAKTGIYYSWYGMKQRCGNPNNNRYKDYGGRGIIVCEEWMEFPNFLKDMGNGWKSGLTIERKNNNEGYCKKNCKWTTKKEQNRNSRRNCLIKYDGKTQCLSAWAEETNIGKDTIWGRLYKLGWSPEKTLTTPVRRKRKNK